MYQHPGVYIEHVPSSALAVEAASTSVAAFIGHIGRGEPVNGDGNPVFISSVAQYAEKFGPAGGGLGGIRNNVNDADHFGLAINAYFANGGTKAYIVPLATGSAAAATGTILVTVASTNYTIAITASSPGTWADGLIAELRDDGINNEVTLVIGTVDTDGNPDQELEVISGLSLEADSPKFIDNRVASLSGLVTVAATAEGAGGTFTDASVTLAGGVAGNAVGQTHFTDALTKLRDYRDISILCLPGRTWQSDQTIFEAAITHAEFMQNRMVIVNSDSTVLTTPNEVQSAGFPTSPYAALYYPQMTVQNPHFNAETAGNLPRTFNIGPAAFAAGLWGRIDTARGVWKAPAGLEATVRGALGPTIKIGNDIQDNLNEWGVNCIRSIIGPSVIWGGRTLATKSKPQYRYIPVRRTQNMIGESLYRALQAVVFEPNDHKLWGSLRASVGDFMSGLHRAGAFQGEKASDAYFVRCGLGSTMTQGDIDAGIVRLSVGFAALKPAEFVVVQIEQKVGQAA